LLKFFTLLNSFILNKRLPFPGTINLKGMAVLVFSNKAASKSLTEVIYGLEFTGLKLQPTDLQSVQQMLLPGQRRGHPSRE
jgi:hypothetical protein